MKLKQFVILHGAFADAAYFQEKLVSVWQGRGATPLQMAAHNGHVEALRILLQALSKDFEQRLCLIRLV